MNDLPTATLGPTGLEITKLGYGAMEPRGMMGREIDPSDTTRLLKQVPRHRAGALRMCSRARTSARPSGRVCVA